MEGTPLRGLDVVPNDYVIDVTAKLDPEQASSATELAADLRLIKEAFEPIDSIVVRGGTGLDIVLGREPNDYDLFYTARRNGAYITTCICDEVRASIADLKFTRITHEKIDLENALEKEPRLDPVERTCGRLSYHTSYTNMFAIDTEDKLWTNTDSWRHIQNRVHEVRPEGFFPWANFPRSGDSQNYYAFYGLETMRGLGTCLQRDLSCGPMFRGMLEYAPFFIEQALQLGYKADLLKCARAKIKDNASHAAALIKQQSYPPEIEKSIIQTLDTLLSEA